MPVPLPDLPQTEAAVIEMTNAFRGENHLATVAPNAALVGTGAGSKTIGAGITVPTDTQAQALMRAHAKKEQK